MSAKKSFKNENPALRFIGQGVDHEIPMPKSDSPRSAPEQPVAQYPMKPNPLYIETKSRRLYLLMRPSLHDKIKAIAKERGSSVNDAIHKILQDYVNNQGAN
jgi:hypothetical protein